MKRLFICGLFLVALTFAAFFFGQIDTFVYWGTIIGTSILVGTFLGMAFGEADIADEKPVVRSPAAVRSRQF